MQDNTTRRAAIAALLAVGAVADAAAQQHDHAAMEAGLAQPKGPEDIAFLLYPGCTALDFVGPHNMLRGLMGATVRLVAKTRDPIVTDTRLTVLPDTTFTECPENLTLICVPGGTEGTLAAMQDAETLEFLASRGRAATWVTGVCTGSLVLGAAGLLRGYRATSHWVTRDILSEFGATPVAERVVVDRNRATGGGVTAGIDFGLSMVAALRDDDYARAVQLVAEYDPAPPFAAGSPSKAPAATTKMITEMFAPFMAEARRIAQSAALRMPG
ncbi:MAG: DJ-1/PfpI family protein [Paracraurococcus sp.]